MPKISLPSCPYCGNRLVVYLRTDDLSGSYYYRAECVGNKHYFARDDDYNRAVSFCQAMLQYMAGE